MLDLATNWTTLVGCLTSCSEWPFKSVDPVCTSFVMSDSLSLPLSPSQSSSFFRSRESLLAEMERHGGTFDCQRFRDVMLYSVSVFSASLPEAVRILADALWRPALREEEVRCNYSQQPAYIPASISLSTPSPSLSLPLLSPLLPSHS